jgi:hypothetical protein
VVAFEKPSLNLSFIALSQKVGASGWNMNKLEVERLSLTQSIIARIFLRFLGSLKWKGGMIDCSSVLEYEFQHCCVVDFLLQFKSMSAYLFTISLNLVTSSLLATSPPGSTIALE